MVIVLLISILSLDANQTYLINYFQKNHTKNFLIQDRASDKTTISCAASGFGMVAYAIMAEQGIWSRGKSMGAIHDCLSNTTRLNWNGWLYHFTDPDGNPKFNREVSTVDTALFYLGARLAARRMGDENLKNRVETLIAGINLPLMMRGKYFCHGGIPTNDNFSYFTHLWDEYSEGILLYKLFDKEFVPVLTRYDLPLFVYYYPICYYPNDKDILTNLTKAIDFQVTKYGYFGITACDGQLGYEVNNPDLVSPLALYSISKLDIRAKKEGALHPHRQTVGSFSRSSGWTSRDDIGIDIGACLILQYFE